MALVLELGFVLVLMLMLMLMLMLIPILPYPTSRAWFGCDVVLVRSTISAVWIVTILLIKIPARSDSKAVLRRSTPEHKHAPFSGVQGSTPLLHLAQARFESEGLESWTARKSLFSIHFNWEMIGSGSALARCSRC